MGFQKLAGFFREAVGTPETPESHERRLRLATASVLLETAYADESITIDEEQSIAEYLRERFDLGPDDARELLEEADELRSRAIDHFAMTNLLRQTLNLSDRIDIVKEMWRLVYRDGRLHQYENHLVRKLADLLGLEHHVMIEAKMAVRAELGFSE